MKNNEHIKIIGTNVILIPYKEKHVKRQVSFTLIDYGHNFMLSKYPPFLNDILSFPFNRQKLLSI